MEKRLECVENEPPGFPTELEQLEEWRLMLTKVVDASKNEPPKSVKGKQATDARDALFFIDLLARCTGFTEQMGPLSHLENAVKLGILFERMRLRGIEPWIGKSPRNSKAAALKAKKTSLLSDAQWDKVIKHIVKLRSRGIGITDACRDTASQLKTGALRALPGIMLESCDPSTIVKRFNKRQR
ncbi:MAG TPA: hypothetical protein VFW73_08325 [Lacipirellulaceae bacterium]|nr:hypothetical protein [Lacipirellulaceae bacterium]